MSAPRDLHDAAAARLVGGGALGLDALVGGGPPLSRDRTETFALRLDRYYDDLVAGLREIHPDPEVRDALVLRLVELAAAAYAERPDELHRLDAQRLLTPDWLQQPADVRLRLLHRPVRRRPARHREAARPPRGPRGHLPAPDAAAPAARGRQRRRLRRAGLPRRPQRPRHHGRPARPGDDAARARDQPVHGPRAQPRRDASTSGRPGRAPATRVARTATTSTSSPTRPCPTPTSRRCPRCSRTSRPATSPGTTTCEAWVWTTFNEFQWDLNWANPSVLVEFAEIILGLANLGVEVLRLDAIAFLWKRLGTNCQNQPEVHAITQALRAVTRIAAPAVAFKAEAIVGPRDLVQYLGTGQHAGRVSDLAYHNSLMVQVWSMLAAAQHRARPAGARRAAGDAVDRHLDHLRPLPRRHRLGDRRPRRPRRRRHRPRAPGVPVRLVLRRVPRHLGRRAGLPGQPGDRRPADQRHGGVAGRAATSGATSGPAVDNALARIFLAHAVVAGWGGIPVIWSGDELAQANDPDWASEPGHEDDNRWAHRPRLDWSRAVARDDLRTVPGRVFTGLAHLASVRARLPQLHASARRPRSCRTPTTACSPSSAGTPAAPSSGSTTSPSRRRPFELHRLHDARPDRRRTTRSAATSSRSAAMGDALAAAVRRLVGGGRARVSASAELDVGADPVPSTHVIRFEKVTKTYPGTGPPGARPGEHRHREGRVRLPRRPVGLRQVHRAAPGAARDPLHLGPRPRRRQGPQPARRLEGAAAAPPDRHRVPGLPAAAQQDRHRERRVRAPGDRQVPRRDPQDRARDARSWSASTARATGCPTSCPAASSSASRSRARSSTGR